MEALFREKGWDGKKRPRVCGCRGGTRQHLRHCPGAAFPRQTIYAVLCCAVCCRTQEDEAFLRSRPQSKASQRGCQSLVEARSHRAAHITVDPLNVPLPLHDWARLFHVCWRASPQQPGPALKGNRRCSTRLTGEPRGRVLPNGGRAVEDRSRMAW